MSDPFNIKASAAKINGDELTNLAIRIIDAIPHPRRQRAVNDNQRGALIMNAIPYERFYIPIKAFDYAIKRFGLEPFPKGPSNSDLRMWATTAAIELGDRLPSFLYSLHVVGVLMLEDRAWLEDEAGVHGTRVQKQRGTVAP